MNEAKDGRGMGQSTVKDTQMRTRHQKVCYQPKFSTAEPPHEKPTIYMCVNKDTDQLRGNR